MASFASLDRRAFLRASAIGAAGLALPWRAQAQVAISATPVDANSAVFTGAGANVFATRSDAGLILVDTGLAEHAGALRAALRDHFGDDRIAAAFNTHWHHDNSGGDAMVIAAGGKVYAHENTRLWLDGDFWSVWDDRIYKPLPREAQPTDTFYKSGSVTIGGREAVYTFLPRGHTDGDIAVVFPDANVIATGGLVTVGAYPVMDYTTGGWIGALSQANARLLEMTDADVKVVPDRGPVVGRDHLQKQMDMLDTVRERIYERVRLGKAAEDMLADGVTAEFDAEWGDPELFVRNIYPGLFAHSAEVGGIV